jgi:hypothetical protein
VHRLAVAGLLRVSERRAVDVVHAAGTGAVLALLAMPPDERDLDLTEAMYEAAARVILTSAPAPVEDTAVAAAVTFRTVTPRLPGLTDAERALMGEWLDRAITGSRAPTG